MNQVKNLSRLRIISATLLLALALSLTACGSAKETAGDPTQSAQVSETQKASDAAAPVSTEAAKESETAAGKSDKTTSSSAENSSDSAPAKSDTSVSKEQNSGSTQNSSNSSQDNTNQSNSNSNKNTDTSGNSKPAPAERPTAAPAAQGDRDNAEVSINDL